MAAKFGLKSVGTLLEELIKFLPTGSTWRAAGVRVAGKVLGVPAGVDDSFVVIQGFAADASTLPLGLILKDPLSGLLFAHETGSGIGTTVAELLFTESFEEHPTLPGRAIVTFSVMTRIALSGNWLEFTAPSGYAPKIDTDDLTIPQVRTRATYVPGSSEAGKSQFHYELADPFAARNSPQVAAAGVTFGARFTGQSFRLRALEEGSQQNLPEATILVPSVAGSAPNLANCVVSHVIDNTGGNGFAGGEDATESLFRQCLRGWATAFKRINDIIHLWVFDIPGVDPATLGGIDAPDILGLEHNLEDYERAYGIPDSCFPGAAEPDREVRKRHLIVKMSKLNVLTCPDFVAIAKLMDRNIICQAGIDSSLFTDGILTQAEARHTVVIIFLLPQPLSFPYTFEDRDPPEPDGMRFGNNDVSILECLFTKLVPSTSQVLFQYQPA